MDTSLLFLVAMAAMVSIATGMPIEPESTSPSPDDPLPMDEAELKKYFQEYDYMQSPNDDPNSPSAQLKAQDVEEAIRVFERRWNLTETGKAEGETLRYLRMDRCGNVDKLNPESKKRRKKRYELQGSQWPHPDLSYKITEYPTDALSQQNTDSIIARALGVWAEVSPLRFNRHQGNDEADIQVLFASQYHGDGQPFDGEGRILAHAYFPGYGGDAHFDDDESWTDESSSGINLFQVAAHEFGHSLGLSHSENRNALMAPFYQGYQTDFSLHDDDIAGIQALYGSNTDDRPPQTQPPPIPPPQPTPAPPPGAPNFCANSRFDTVTRHEIDGRAMTYAFQGDYYALITNSGMAPYYPRRISQDWPGLPGNLDAALFWETEYEYESVNGQYQRTGIRRKGRTYFFKGDQYWRYEDMELMASYPRQIEGNWRGLPNDIDAAFVWSGNQRTYFVKGDQYYRYTSMRGVDPGYPRHMSVWEGVPWPIDGAVQWQNRKTYFFHKEQYYRFNDPTFHIDRDYPRSNSYWWLGCTGNNLMHEDARTRLPDNETTTQATNEEQPSSAAGCSMCSYMALTVVGVVCYLMR